MKFDKQVKYAIVLTVVFTIVLAVLGMINQWKSCFTDLDRFLDHKMRYIDNTILSQLDSEKDYSGEEIYEIISSGFRDNPFLNANETEVLVYDTNNDVLSGNISNDGLNAILKYNIFHHFPYITDTEKYYCVYEYNNYKVILNTSWETSHATASATIDAVEKLFVALFVVLSIFFLYILFFHKKIDTPKMVRLIKRIGLLLIILFEIYIFVLNYAVSLINDYYDLEAVIEEIGTESYDISLMSDEEVAYEYSLINKEDELLTDYLNSKNYDDPRTLLLCVRIYPLLQDEYDFDGNINNIIYKSNIWDTSVPIRDRIEIEYNEAHFINTIVSHILQYVMFIMLYVILMGLAPKDMDKAEKLYKNTAIAKLNQIVFLKTISESLVTVVAMSILFGIVTDHYSDSLATIITNLTVALAGVVSLLVVVILPKLIRKLGNLRRILIMSFVICIIGSILCLMTGEVWYFIFGYIIISFSEGVSENIQTFYPLLTEKDPKDGISGVSTVRNVSRIATLLGMVAGGVLVSFFSSKVIYFISLLILIACLFLSLRIPRDENTKTDIKDVDIKRVFYSKQLTAIFILVIVPLGFINYCFKIFLPLNIVELGLSTTLVSFLLFFRQACVYFFKNDNKSKAFWKKSSDRNYVVAGLSVTALIFIGFYFVKNVYVMFLLTLFLAFVQSGMSSKVRNLVYEANEADDNRVFENTFIYSEGNRIGKSVAPVISSINICLLSIVMAIGAGLYWIYTGKTTKKDKK